MGPLIFKSETYDPFTGQQTSYRRPYTPEEIAALKEKVGMHYDRFNGWEGQPTAPMLTASRFQAGTGSGNPYARIGNHNGVMAPPSPNAQEVNGRLGGLAEQDAWRTQDPITGGSLAPSSMEKYRSKNELQRRGEFGAAGLYDQYENSANPYLRAQAGKRIQGFRADRREGLSKEADLAEEMKRKAMAANPRLTDFDARQHNDDEAFYDENWGRAKGGPVEPTPRAGGGSVGASYFSHGGAMADPGYWNGATTDNQFQSKANSLIDSSNARDSFLNFAAQSNDPNNPHYGQSQAGYMGGYGGGRGSGGAQQSFGQSARGNISMNPLLAHNAQAMSGSSGQQRQAEAGNQSQAAPIGAATPDWRTGFAGSGNNDQRFSDQRSMADIVKARNGMGGSSGGFSSGNNNGFSGSGGGSIGAGGISGGISGGGGFNSPDAQAARAYANQQNLQGQQYGTSERQAREKYGTGERQAAEAFGAGQAKIGRDFSAQQAIKARSFHGGQTQGGYAPGFGTQQPMRLPGMAKGGPAKSFNPYLVGEKGPELYVPKKGEPEIIGAGGPEVRTFPEKGTIIPNHKLNPMVEGGDVDAFADKLGPMGKVMKWMSHSGNAAKDRLYRMYGVPDDLDEKIKMSYGFEPEGEMGDEENVYYPPEQTSNPMLQAYGHDLPSISDGHFRPSGGHDLPSIANGQSVSQMIASRPQLMGPFAMDNPYARMSAAGKMNVSMNDARNQALGAAAITRGEDGGTSWNGGTAGVRINPVTGEREAFGPHVVSKPVIYAKGHIKDEKGDFADRGNGVKEILERLKEKDFNGPTDLDPEMQARYAAQAAENERRIRLGLPLYKLPI